MKNERTGGGPCVVVASFAFGDHGPTLQAAGGRGWLERYLKDVGGRSKVDIDDCRTSCYGDSRLVMATANEGIGSTIM